MAISDEAVEAAVDCMTTPYLRTLLLSVGGDLEENRNIARAIARAALSGADAVRGRTEVSDAEAIHQWWADKRGSAEVPQALIDLYRTGKLMLSAAGDTHDR